LYHDTGFFTREKYHSVEKSAKQKAALLRERPCGVLYRELVDDSTDGALTSASAAANASTLIDLIRTALIGDSANGALSSAAAATNARISNLHGKVPPFSVTYIVAYISKNAMGYCKYSFGFCRQ
jgi:cephalosporin-C deacetylase-like acetyl esterase